MKTCNGCKYAEWKMTKIGRLHQSGDGLCKKVVEFPKLPNAFRYITTMIAGGKINRKREYAEHCPYYSR